MSTCNGRAASNCTWSSCKRCSVNRDCSGLVCGRMCLWARMRSRHVKFGRSRTIKLSPVTTINIITPKNLTQTYPDSQVKKREVPENGGAIPRSLCSRCKFRTRSVRIKHTRISLRIAMSAQHRALTSDSHAMCVNCQTLGPESSDTSRSTRYTCSPPPHPTSCPTLAENRSTPSPNRQ